MGDVTDDLPDRRVVVCNYAAATNIASAGAKAYVIPQLGGNLPERVRVLVQFRGGRWVEKWENMRRLDNFRLKTIPPEHPKYTDERLWTADPEESLRRAVTARAQMDAER